MPWIRALAALLLFAASGTGDGPAAGVGEVGVARARAQAQELEHGPPATGPITVGALLVWGGSELLKPRLAPAPCLTCEVNGFDRAARLLLVADDGRPYATASDVIAFGVLPAAAITSTLANARAAGQSWNSGFDDLLVVTEAVALAGVANQVTKFAVGRTRPFVRFGNFADADRAPDPDDALSFYSGHTSFAFSLTTATATVATLRRDPSAPWLWGGGLLLAGTVGWLRIAADRHYLSDVLVGALVGSAFGVGVPYLFHRPQGGSASAPSGRQVTPLPVGIAFAF